MSDARMLFVPRFSVNRKLRGWIPTILFWVLFAAGLGFGRRYPWLDTVCYAAGMLFVLGLSAYTIVYKLRHRHEPGSLSYQWMPRWLQRLLVDEDPEPEEPGNRDPNKHTPPV